MLARRCFVIVNPTSGSYAPSKIDRIIAALTLSGLDPVLLPTQSALDSTLFASRICADHPDPLIVVAAGDGTINGVLNGLVPGAATLGIIPLGTSNVLARELEIKSVDHALRRVERGKTRVIPVGEMDSAGQKRRFVLMAGVGVDGAVVEGVRLSEKRVCGKGAYVLSALRVLMDWDSEVLKVTGGGQSLSCHTVIVCNASKYGGNLVLTRGGNIFTPGFQVVCIKGGPLSYLKLFLELGLGRVGNSESVTIFPAGEVTVEGAKAVQCDGDFFGFAPLRISSIPDFARIIV